MPNLKHYLGRVKYHIEEIPNRGIEQKVAELRKSLTQQADQKSGWVWTSDKYISLCYLAATRDDVFEIFKRTRDYRQIVETASKKQGAAYAALIEKEYSPAMFDKFRENDQIGDPIVFPYSVGIFSPTTLRYASVLSDLTRHFGSLDGLHIMEIGAGYGGQAKVISDVYRFGSYTVVDLPAVNQLIKKYTATMNVDKISFEPEEKPYDLLISNYAFSECARETQDDYIKRFLSKAKRGYMIYNYNGVSAPGAQYNKKEIVEVLSKYHDVKVYEEVPKTSPDNFVIVWGEKA